MDQKKTLWIIASVGAFLLAVLGAALIMYAPLRNQPKPIASVTTTTIPHPNTGWTNAPDLVPAANIPVPNQKGAEKVSEMIVLSDNTKVYGLPSDEKASNTIDLNTLKQEIAVNPEPQTTTIPAQPQNINITVNIPENAKESVTNEYYVSNTNSVEIKESAPKPAFVPAPGPKKTEKAEVQNKAPAKTVEKAPAKATPAPEAKKITQYWVQVAAYSNKKGAEGARSVLDSNKIPADIFTFQDNKNNLFYRVRVGPYTTKSEAEYWRTRIIQINEFSKAESYVTSTTN